MDANTATIISGLLSMAGGAAGALGAFFAAKKQINKQEEISKSERNSIVRQTNLQFILETLFEIKYLIDVTYSQRLVVEYNLSILIKQGFTYYGGNELETDKRDILSVVDGLKKIDYLVNVLKSKSIIFENLISTEEINKAKAVYIGDSNKFNNIYINKESIRPIDFKESFHEFTNIISKNKDDFLKVIKSCILTVELELKKELAIN